MVTVRVYGVYLNSKKQVLVSDELIKSQLFCKFPGGGLEFGEGTRDCLVREFKEEMLADVVVKDHLYTTDFFVESAFARNVQVMSIYYEIDFIQSINLPVQNQSPEMSEFIFNNPTLSEKHRLIDLENFQPSVFQLPIDQVVASLIIEKFK